MKKIIYIAIIVTLIGFIPVIHQELTGCSAFGYDHLASPAVMTTSDSCSTTFFAVPLIPSVQLSRVLFSNSAYINYLLLAITSIILYSGIGYIIMRVIKRKNP